MCRFSILWWVLNMFCIGILFGVGVVLFNVLWVCLWVSCRIFDLVVWFG